LNSPLLHSRILSWYKKNRRDLPWRKTKNPYRILLSEVMAQQTQVARVALFYSAWLKKFPTISDLAKASRADVLRQWSGLGYNSRALRLHELAKRLADGSNGKLPLTVDELASLPGVGRYTAHAVACFAFGADVPVVDVNIRRIFSRIFWKVRSTTQMQPENIIWDRAEQYLPYKDASVWNQALMDLGAMICTARNPQCGACPINMVCKSAHAKAFTKKDLTVKKPEPSFKGIPRRIYRGRILKALHDKPLTPRLLAERVIRQFDHDDLQWLTELLKTMERETLIAIRGSGENQTVWIAQ
jgi:A/G-specific adenine glycosylase